MYVKKNNQVIRKSLNTSQDLSQLMKKYIQYDKEKPHSISSVRRGNTNRYVINEAITNKSLDLTSLSC